MLLMAEQRVECSGGPLCGVRVSDVGPVCYAAPHEIGGVWHAATWSPAPLHGRDVYCVYRRRQNGLGAVWYEYEDTVRKGMEQGDGYREAA